jgi:hypothetical protein
MQRCQRKALPPQQSIHLVSAVATPQEQQGAAAIAKVLAVGVTHLKRYMLIIGNTRAAAKCHCCLLAAAIPMSYLLLVPFRASAVRDYALHIQ